MFRTLSIAASLACIATVAKGHEFWIDPENYIVEPGAQIVADIKVGEDFKGGKQSYLPPNFRRFDYVYTGQAHPVEGRMGDLPAVRMDAPGEGLVVFVHETTDLRLAWDSYEKFESFVIHKDAAWTLQSHADRGLPKKDVTEVYSRYAKSLVAVGDGAGSDLETGLLTEIVALENPYTDDMSDGIDVQVFYEGNPRAGAQLEVFDEPVFGRVSVFTVKADEQGRATIPVKPGNKYQLDSVVLREPSPELAASKNAQWESLWANLTFAVPAR